MFYLMLLLLFNASFSTEFFKRHFNEPIVRSTKNYRIASFSLHRAYRSISFDNSVASSIIDMVDRKNFEQVEKVLELRF